MARAQELTLNTIILAALAVLILIISSALIYKYVIKGQEPIDDCQNFHGTCEDVPCAELGRSSLGTKNCVEGQQCCYVDEQNT